MLLPFPILPIKHSIPIITTIEIFSRDLAKLCLRAMQHCSTCETRLKSGKLLEIRLVFCYNFIVSFIDCIFAVIVFRLHSVWENIFQALFLCFLTGSTEPGGHIGASLCVYNFILAVWQQSTQRMCKFILWVLFYIDRSRKVPPTFFLGEPYGLP